MKVVLTILLLTLVGASTQQFLCPRNYCEGHPCVNQTSCPEHETLAPTFCRCCFRCVPTIGEGGRCIRLFGEPPRAVCEKGLTCCSGICREHCPRAG